MKKWTGFVMALVLGCATLNGLAKSKDLGNGFTDHGSVALASVSRGIVATTNGEGQDVALVWLYDHRGAYGLLMINVETGKYQTFPTPPSMLTGGDASKSGVYASLLSSDGKYYTQFHSEFIEFDPAKPGFTFRHKTKPGKAAMSMTEDDQGRIWAVTSPDCGLISYDPRTGTFHDYGHVHPLNWKQYPRWIAADDTGWVYFSEGNTKTDITGFNPQTGKSKPVVPEADRRSVTYASVYRATDGTCYGLMRKVGWYQFHGGETTKLGSSKPKFTEKKITAGTQSLFDRQFPDGKRIERLSLFDRELVVKDPKTGETQKVAFDYKGDGSYLMSIGAMPNGKVIGAQTYPSVCFIYDPANDSWTRHRARGQWNTIATNKDGRVFVGAYSDGYLLEFDPTSPWEFDPASLHKRLREHDRSGNPRALAQALPTVNRPADLLIYPDGGPVILAGTPAYGQTGGG